MYNHNLCSIHLLMMMRRLSCKHPLFILGCCRSRNHLLFSTSRSRVEIEEKNEPVVTVDYLINSCGLSVEEAKKASKSFIRSYRVTPKPDSVLAFLRENGFTPTHIRALICKLPELLCAKVDKTLKPKLAFFRELGFSDAAFAGLAAKNPYLLLHSADKHLRPTVDCLRTIIHSDKSLVNTIRRYSWILTCNQDRHIRPTIEILRECGFSQSQIQLFVLRQPMLITMPGYVRKAIDRAQKFGFKRQSPMFANALRTMLSLSAAAFDEKVKMLKSFGWTEEEISSAFRREPQFLMASESKFRAVMGFLAGELKFGTRKMADQPKLFMYSLEKRLVPRNEVLKVLKSRGWVKPDLQLITVVNLSDKDFLNKYVLPFSDRHPHFVDVFMAGARG